MLKISLLCATGAALLFGSEPVTGARDRLLSDRDVNTLAKSISEWLEAKAEVSGIDEARDEVSEALAKAMKKAKVDDGLMLVEDLGRAFYLATEYDKKTGRKGAIETVESEFGGKTFEYALWLPKSYDTDDGPYPLIVAVGEPGQSPKQHIEANWIDPDVRNGAIILAVPMPDDTEVWNVLGEDFEGGVTRIMRGMFMTTLVAADVDRIFLAGRGQSAIDACMATASMYPLRFAGVIGRTGDMGETAPTNFRNVATYFAGAGANASAFSEAAGELGFENVTVAPEATEADVWAWMQENARDPYPTHISFSPVIAQARATNWISLDRFDYEGECHLEAASDRETNTITIDGRGIDTVWLYLNDEIVDMDETIRVVCNGVEHEQSVPRNLEFALDNFRRSRDFGRVFTAQLLFELPTSANE